MVKAARKSPAEREAERQPWRDAPLPPARSPQLAALLREMIDLMRLPDGDRRRLHDQLQRIRSGE